jgi:NADPH-dependent curcumin reductase CurA
LGFIVHDYAQKAQEVSQILTDAVRDGRLSIGEENETVVPTRFEDIPKTWNMLYEGKNFGKLVTKLT